MDTASKKDILVMRFGSYLAHACEAVDKYRQWAIVTLDHKREEIVITPCRSDVAKKTIKAHNLVRALTNSDGVVYDSPEQTFRKKARGLCYRIHDKTRPQ